MSSFLASLALFFAATTAGLWFGSMLAAVHPGHHYWMLSAILLWAAIPTCAFAALFWKVSEYF